MSLRNLLLTGLMTCLTMSATALAATPEPPQVSAEAAVVMDADTGDVLYTKNPDQRMYPGSTTKIMTAILGVELGKAQGQLDQQINITQDSLNLESDASVLGLQPGDQVTLRNAMKGMMIVSGCDVAVDVAETVMPTQWQFVQAMNDKAVALGATSTHFVNPHGLPDYNHYTTARDLARIAAYGMKLPEFRNMVKDSAWDMPINGGYQHVNSTNYFLTSGFPGADGIKTGTTNMGGACLVASATQGGRTVLATILNSDDRFGDAQTLMTYGFQALKAKRPTENVYFLRNAPAGQTLSGLAAQKAKEEAAKAAVTTPTAAQTDAAQPTKDDIPGHSAKPAA